MLDLKHYAELRLNESDAKLILKIYKKKSFKSLNSAAFFFKNVDESSLSWMKKEETKKHLLETVKKFAEFLNDEQMSFEEKKELVLASCDKDTAQFSFLEYKGSGMTTTCKCPNPNCIDATKNKLSAWIPEKGTAKSVMCNHRTSCGFSGDFIHVYATHYGKTYGEALNLLAQEYNIDFTTNEFHVGEKVQPKKLEAPVVAPVVVKEIEYMSLNSSKTYRSVNFMDFITKFDEMQERQQFMMIATAIYEFSKTTKQWGKTKYFKNIGVDVKENPCLVEKVEMVKDKLGFLHAVDIPDLLKHLNKLFSEKSLVKFGVINPRIEDGKSHKFPLAFKQSVEEGLVVIPNFDLYTNMCSGLKYRKTRLKSWYDKKKKERVVDSNKEPEFSYGRIAQPLPYHLTLEALKNPMCTFRFFEGQKDLHSIPHKENVCDVAIPGVNGINEEMLGLFKSKKVKLYFDQDEAGQQGAQKLKELLEKAGAIVSIKKWDIKLGSDVNEVLQNKKIKEIV